MGYSLTCPVRYQYFNDNPWVISLVLVSKQGEQNSTQLSHCSVDSNFLTNCDLGHCYINEIGGVFYWLHHITNVLEYFVAVDSFECHVIQAQNFFPIELCHLPSLQ